MNIERLKQLFRDMCVLEEDYKSEISRANEAAESFKRKLDNLRAQKGEIARAVAFGA